MSTKLFLPSDFTLHVCETLTKKKKPTAVQGVSSKSDCSWAVQETPRL